MIGFGQYGKKRADNGIVSLADARLMKIAPNTIGFFDKVLRFVSTKNEIKEFIEAVNEVKEANLSAFWKPIYDPSLEGKNVVFKKGMCPAVGHSFAFWKRKANEMATVEGKSWSVGTEYQYYAFLVWLINRLVEDEKWNIGDAMNAVVINSKELGHYWNSKNAKKDFENTGSREICGVCDLANTWKMLSVTNDEDGGFWGVGGGYNCNSDDFPLACLFHDTDVDYNVYCAVGWLVLS